MITQRVAVLDKLRVVSGRIHFGQPTMDRDSETALFFDEATWIEMGSPPQITVLLKPGNEMDSHQGVTEDRADDIGGLWVEGQITFGGDDDDGTANCTSG